MIKIIYIEEIDYEYPSYKITASAPGSDLAAETSASMVNINLIKKKIY